MTIFEQIITICKTYKKDYFSAKEIIDLVEKEFHRNRKSIIPSDFCYNRINHGITFINHIFIFTEEKYRFVDVDFPYSGPIYAEGKKQRIVGLWENGKFYLWENFPKVSKDHPKRISGESIGIIELNNHNSIFLAQIENSFRDSGSARQKRLKKAAKIPEKVAVITQVYVRNPDVIAEVLIRANGQCEICRKSAPFYRKKDGTPYLEVHHKIPLAHGGEDTIDNAVALCPNCHREQHFG